MVFARLIRRCTAWFGRPRSALDRLLHSAMPLDPSQVTVAMVQDLLVDRRAQRRAGFWKACLYFLMFSLPVVIYGTVYARSLGFSFGPGKDSAGVVRIEGEIAATGLASADRVNAALKAAFEADNVKVVVLAIDSPGGSPVEAERIIAQLASLRKTHPKPVVSVISNIGASAAYMIAMHSDKVVAGRYSLVGSIGAVIAAWDFHKALERVDVSQRVYASGELKAMLNPYLPMSEQANQKATDLVAGLGKQFQVELQQARGARLKAGVNYGTGEVWSGDQAHTMGLVDELGTLESVVQGYKATTHEFGPRNPTVPFLGGAADWLRGVVLDTLGSEARLK